jgi:transposase
MDAPAPLPPDVLATLPPSVVAFIQWQTEQINRLTARVAELEAKLNKNPTNSSKPPSSTHPHDKSATDKPKSKRQRGGQPGHDKHERALIATAECQEVVPCVPTECRRCHRELHGVDDDPLRHQVWELPEMKPFVTEYQQHRLTCSCGCTTCGELPKGAPTGQAGPRLVAFAALLMAHFRQSKRRAAQFLSTILNQPASAGWMVLLQNRAAQAVLPAYNALAEQLPQEPMLNIDESPTKEGQAKAWVWTFVAATFTVFVCATSRAAGVAKKVLGADYDGIIHCDRARMYWCFGRLQWCWAHLKRDFQAWIEDPCPAKQQLGRDLMKQTKKMFALWQKVRDGTLTREAFRRQMEPIRVRVETVLVRAYVDPLTENIVKELLEHIDNLWTFVDVEGVEPTNNAAEQALRHAVIWRKLSFGTQSASGSRFVERLLTVIETCRRQERNAFTWLTEAVRADFHGERATSLLSAV